MSRTVDKKRKEQLDQLRALDHAADKLRSQLGVHRPGAVLWRAITIETEFLAEADGYGGARALEVEGNFPLKYHIIQEQICPTEAEACRIVEGWFTVRKDGAYDPDRSLAR